MQKIFILLLFLFGCIHQFTFGCDPKQLYLQSRKNLKICVNDLRDMNKNLRIKFIDDKIISSLEEVLKSNDEDLVSRGYVLLAQAYWERAKVTNSLADLKEIEKALLNAIRAYPENMSAYLGLARYYIEAPLIAGRNLEKAKDMLNEVLRREPNNILGMYVLAEWYEAKKMYQKAISVYTDIISSDLQGNYVIYYLRGKDYFLCGAFKRAIDDFRTYVDFEENNEKKIWGYYYMARSYLKIGLKEEACLALRKGLKCYPDSKKLSSLLKEIEKE